jgi:hypothetical protein
MDGGGDSDEILRRLLKRGHRFLDRLQSDKHLLYWGPAWPGPRLHLSHPLRGAHVQIERDQRENFSIRVRPPESASSRPS